MNGLDFLRLVLPPSGWYVGFAKKQVEGETVRRHMAFPTIEALHAWCVRYDNNEFDVYYACSSFKQDRVWDAAAQKWTRRTHENVYLIADLWADVDTRLSKPNAPYADHEEAATAVFAFCRAENIPSPLWVCSGGGLHIHWPLAVAMGLDQWHPFALGLKRAAKNFGLEIDPVRTADASSILRVPGTLHHGIGRHVQASALVAKNDPAWFQHLTRHVNGNENRSRSVGSRSHALNDSPIAAAINSDLGYDASDPNLIRRGCAQVGRIAGEPKAYGEPVNRLLAGTLKTCGWAGARDLYLSWLDPEWRSVGANYFDKWSVDPPRCETFESLLPGGCDGCAIKGQAANPLWWGRQAERKIERLATARVGNSSWTGASDQPEKTASDTLNGFPILGPRWGFDTSNRLCEVSEDKKGHPIHTKVSEHPIYLSGVHNSEVLDRCSYTFKHYLPNEGWAEINIPADEMGNGRGIPELMANGVIVHDPKLFMEYMKEQVGEFNRVPGQRRSVKYEQCGWKGADYLCGNVLFESNGGVRKVVTNDEIASRTKLGLGPVGGGDARVWVSITNQLFPLDHYCAWLNIGASFGSMYMPWHSRTEGGVLVSNFTPESGKGKTRIAQVCAGIWGQWDALSIKDYDTAASQGLILACLNNIPAFIDELAHFARHPQFGIVHLRELVDKFSAGHDKHRALQHGMGIRHQLGRWCMIMITTSNQLIVDMLDVQGGTTIGGNAPGMRIAEFDATPPLAFNTHLGDQLEPHIWLNAGHAGDRFLRHVIRPDMQTVARKMNDDWAKLLWEQSRFGSEQRFRIRLLCVTATGLTLAQDVGLVPRALDIAAVIQWGQDQIQKRIPVVSINPQLDMASDALSRFLHANVTNTLRVEQAYRPHTYQMVIGQKPQKLVIRHESATRRVYAAAKDFKAFVTNAGFPYTTVVQVLKAQRILRDDKRMLTLGAGTEYASVQVPCVEFDGAHPIFGSLLQEVPNAHDTVLRNDGESGKLSTA